MSERDPLERRLQAHLKRVAEQPPRAGFEQRIIDAATHPSRVATFRATAAVILVVVVLAALFALVTGHETNTVYSNVSSGLAQ